MTKFNPRNRNNSGHDGKTSTARWLDDLHEDQPKPCGFEPDRWKQDDYQRGK
jgi:hypothetical protein